MPRPARRRTILALASGAALLAGACPAPRDTGDDTGGGIARGSLSLALPLADPAAIQVPVIGVDHDPSAYEGIGRLTCIDYLGRSFPHCYDGHTGSDFLLDGGFDAMDAGSVEVLAAAAGTVERAEDGHYDRCHGDLATFEVDCDGEEMEANAVTLVHEGGFRTLYWHLMEGSVAVAPGAEVEAGAVLGRVGSSGMSSTPHLHFELQDAGGAVLDPYAGPRSQPETWWCDQGDPVGLPGGCG